MPKIITIIGQKEVGKTTLFRQIIKKHSNNANKKISPLVNYVEELINIKDNIYKLIDTPQFFFSPQNEIEKGIKNQLGELVKKSDLILWVIDGINKNTILINQYLKRVKTPLILLFNKIDLTSYQKNSYFHQELGIKNYLFISALKGNDLDNLTKKIVEILPSLDEKKFTSKNKGLNLLIFGAPNSGKSTLMNCLLQENRSLVTPVAGTTQEPVISEWNWKKINFQMVDTAGITKDQKIKKEVWKNCDLAWAIIDASLPLTKQILQIINLSERHGKPLIMIINKCDLIEDKKSLKEELKNRLKSLGYVPIIYLSALQGKGINLLINILGEMMKQSQKNFSKKDLEQVTEKMLANNPPKYYQGGKLKIYFTKHELGLTHFFIFFINNPKWVHFSYRRYMTNYLRKNLGLEYLPIKIALKKSV